jgi:metallo-beta-lactamase family protein
MLSAHADREELLRWARRLPRPPGIAFMVHGEAGASDMLRRHLRDALGWNCVVPEHGATVALA